MRVIEQIVRTGVHGLPIGGGHGPTRGTPADARGDRTRLAPQNLQQVRPDPPISVHEILGNEGQRGVPDVLRHMDEVDHDDQRPETVGGGRRRQPLAAGAARAQTRDRDRGADIEAHRPMEMPREVVEPSTPPSDAQ